MSIICNILVMPWLKKTTNVNTSRN